MQWAHKSIQSHHKQAKYRGFTIVELLIVVVVIAILAAITIVAYNGIQNRAKDSALKTTAAQAARKFSTYAVTNNDTFPDCASIGTALGLTNGNGVTYQCTVASNAKSYCLTVTQSGKSVYVSSTSSSPVSGGCPGHSANNVATITNYITNPSFEAGTTDWTTSGNMTPNYLTSGGQCGADTYGGTRTSVAAVAIYSGRVDVTPGEVLSARAMVNFTSGRTIYLRFTYFDASSTALSQPTSPNYTGTGAWQSLVIENQTVPVNAATVRLDVLMNTNSAAVGDTFQVDCVMLTRGASVYNYADGDSANWAWNGTAQLSTSTGMPL